jgi:hypothetical protein
MKYYLINEITDEMDKAHNVHHRDEKCINNLVTKHE